MTPCRFVSLLLLACQVSSRGTPAISRSDPYRYLTQSPSYDLDETPIRPHVSPSVTFTSETADPEMASIISLTIGNTPAEAIQLDERATARLIVAVIEPLIETLRALSLVSPETQALDFSLRIHGDGISFSPGAAPFRQLVKADFPFLSKDDAGWDKTFLPLPDASSAGPSLQHSFDATLPQIDERKIDPHNHHGSWEADFEWHRSRLDEERPPLKHDRGPPPVKGEEPKAPDANLNPEDSATSPSTAPTEQGRENGSPSKEKMSPANETATRDQLEERTGEKENRELLPDRFEDRKPSELDDDLRPDQLEDRKPSEFEEGLRPDQFEDRKPSELNDDLRPDQLEDRRKSEVDEALRPDQLEDRGADQPENLSDGAHLPENAKREDLDDRDQIEDRPVEKSKERRPAEQVEERPAGGDDGGAEESTEKARWERPQDHLEERSPAERPSLEKLPHLEDRAGEEGDEGKLKRKVTKDHMELEIGTKERADDLAKIFPWRRRDEVDSGGKRTSAERLGRHVYLRETTDVQPVSWFNPELFMQWLAYKLRKWYEAFVEILLAPLMILIKFVEG